MNDLQKDRLGRIKQSSWHLVSIIDEILTFTRAEAGKARVHIGPVDLLHLTRNVATLLEPRARERDIALRVEPADGSLIVQSDEGKLRQILVNLVGNAVKFTERGEVVIRTTTDDGHIEVHVRDTGPGIPAEHVEKIFEPFYQIDASKTRANGGTGLGLAVCRTLAALLGGRIAVTSTPGVGSTFTLRLPSNPTPDSAPAPEPLPPA
jgi:signal transduction histidine kinase